MVEPQRPEPIEFESSLSLSSLPYLADHQVLGQVVFPATAYLEMALAGAAAALGEGPWGLAEVAFERMLFVPESGERPLRLTLTPDGSGGASFEVLSRPGDTDQPWTRHVAGKVRRQAADTTEPTPPEDVRARCLQEITASEYYDAARQRGLHYGPSFQGIRRLWRRDSEALGELELPGTLMAESAAYQVHPALLDAALQVLAAALPAEWQRPDAQVTYVPRRVAEVRVHGRCPTRVWSRAVLPPPPGPDAPAVEGDVFLLDEDGRVVLEVRGLQAQRLGKDGAAGADDPSAWLYELRWRPKPLPQPAAPVPAAEDAPAAAPESWLVFADRGGLGAALARTLREQGHTCVTVTPGDGFAAAGPDEYRLNPRKPDDVTPLFAAVLAEGRPPLRGVVHLWALDAAPPELTTLASLREAMALGSVSVLHLVQELVRRAGAEAPPGLWLVTRGAQRVGDEAVPVAVAQAPLWGLGKVVTLEHPRLRCTCVDLDPDAAPDAAAPLISELRATDRETQVAYRGGQRHALRLTRLEATAAVRVPSLIPAR